MSTVKEKTLRLVQLGLLSGLIILLQMYFVIPLPGSLTLSLVLVPIVSLLTQKTKPSDVDSMFSCYDKEVVTDVTDSLG